MLFYNIFLGGHGTHVFLQMHFIHNFFDTFAKYKNCKKKKVSTLNFEIAHNKYECGTFNEKKLKSRASKVVVILAHNLTLPFNDL